MSSIVTSVLVLLLPAIIAQPDFTVHPIRHSLPDGLSSVYGSSSNGGCTSLENNMICSLKDGGTSVLVDGTILLLSREECIPFTHWAKDLFTVNSNRQQYSVIGFDFGDFVNVRRLELVLFNCPQLQTATRRITVYGTPTAVNFPLTRDQITNETQVARVGSTTLNSQINSCEELIRVCIPISLQTQVYYVEFFNSAGNDWVFLSEATFHLDDNSCQPSSSQILSNSQEITTTRTDLTTSTRVSQTLPPDNSMLEVDRNNHQNTALLSSTITAITVAMLTATIVVVIHIPLYVWHYNVRSRLANVETVVTSSSNLAAGSHYAAISCSQDGEQGRGIELKMNEAYGTAEIDNTLSDSERSRLDSSEHRRRNMFT